MQGKFGVAALAAAGMMTSGAAWAQARTGVYVAANVGVASVADTDLTYRDDGGTFGGTGTVDTLETRVDTKSAVKFGGAIGYDFGRVRTDIEVDYHRNRIEGLKVDSLNGTPVTAISASDVADFCDYEELGSCTVSGTTIAFDGGRVRQLSALANIWLDLPIGTVVTPYAGGGIGVGGFEIEGEGKARFAWQLGAGVALNVTPGVAITADYRYRQTNGTTFTDPDFANYSLQVGKIKTSTLSAGLRFTF